MVRDGFLQGLLANKNTRRNPYWGLALLARGFEVNAVLEASTSPGGVVSPRPHQGFRRVEAQDPTKT